jgi:uncharacterized BrkB/YihY/UPF0761 family membrane protein
MKSEKYSDKMIEEMLQESAIAAPEDISAAIVAALPKIYSEKLRKSSLWSRKKWMITALMSVMIIALIAILLAMATLRLISSHAKELLNSDTQNKDKVERLP